MADNGIHMKSIIDRLISVPASNVQHQLPITQFPDTGMPSDRLFLLADDGYKPVVAGFFLTSDCFSTSNL